MLSREENELLCRVGPDTPMGRMMRRYWLPIAMSTELAAGAPKRVRLLGENYIAFRGEDGAVGFLDELCPHRGASLVLARTEGCALRCIYHGWLVDRSGTVLEMPAEPEGTAFTAKVRQPSYPVHEHAGLVWAYVGPVATVPPVPDFAFGHVPESHRIVAKHRVDCNWTQAVEGAIDSAHSSYLHSDDIVGKAGVARSKTEGRQTERPSRDGRPRIQTEDAPYGFRYAALRKPIVDPDLKTYARITHFIAPFTAIIPLGELQNVQVFCPIDDEHTYHYNVKFGPAALTPDQRRRLEPRDQTDGDFGTERRRENNWLQDREAMKTATYTGIDVVRNQDTAVQESMGPIFDRSKEHLGVSDTAIIRMRRRMLDAVRAFSDGAEPLALNSDFSGVYGAEGMISLDAPWQHLLGAVGQPTTA
jgi:phthalate 4,5-dioxygenase oxygenase subunit